MLGVAGAFGEPADVEAPELPDDTSDEADTDWEGVSDV